MVPVSESSSFLLAFLTIEPETPHLSSCCATKSYAASGQYCSQRLLYRKVLSGSPSSGALVFMFGRGLHPFLDVLNTGGSAMSRRGNRAPKVLLKGPF
jgi:hypothetical protein